MSELAHKENLVADFSPEEEIRALVRETTINETTLLSTDYCNHLNEFVMMIGMVADMPDLLDEAKSWAPKSYSQHFIDSNLSIGALAIQAYEICPEDIRSAFDDQVDAFNIQAKAGLKELESVISEGDDDYTAFSASALSTELQGIIDRIGGIIHAAPVESPEDDDPAAMSQDEIDAMF